MLTVTGATGFVGRNILRVLIERNFNFRIIVRRLEDLPQWAQNSNIEIIEIDNLFSLSDDGLVDILRGSRCLIHAAWCSSPADPSRVDENFNSLMATLNIARAFELAGGQRFIGLGSCAEYDPILGIHHANSDLRPNTMYGACKASAYQVLSEFFATKQVEFAWCRLFYLYGDGENDKRLAPYIRGQLSRGEPALLTAGNQVRDYLDVYQAAKLIVEVGLSDKNGAFNICSGMPITVKEFAEKIAAETGRYDLLRFGAREDNAFDPISMVGIPSL